MKYILCLDQDYEDVELTAVEVEKNDATQIVKYLENSGDFGNVLSVSNEKPKTYGKLINFKKYAQKRVKELEREFKDAQKEYDKSRKLTQEDLDRQHQEAEQQEQSLLRAFNGTATFATAAMYLLSTVSEIKREAARDLKEAKSVLEFIRSLKF